MSCTCDDVDVPWHVAGCLAGLRDQLMATKDERYVGRAGQLRHRVPPWMLDRQVAHIPVGLAISWLIFLWPLDVAASVLWGARLTAVMLFFGFILYELSEDWRINDWAFRDLEGFAIGLGVGAVAQVLLAVFVGLLVSGGAA